MSDGVTTTIRKYTLTQMEQFIAQHRLRLRMSDGSPCARVDLLLSAEDHFGFEQVNRFLTWLIPHEPRLRDLGRKR